MHPTQIADLLRPFLSPIPGTGHSEKPGAEESAVLSPAQLQAISTYIDILLRWNARINLTAIRDPQQIVTRHFGESFFAARTLFPVGADAPSAPERSQVSEASTTRNHARPEEPRPAAAANGISVADLGSGAGFPGLPIRLWAPSISLTLIESNHKKATFLREAARALTLTSVDIITARAESLTSRAFDVVTLRAVERFETILPVAASLVAPEGRLALLIGSSQFVAAQEHLSRSSPDLKWTTPQPIPLSRTRVLAVAHR
jgi:16S rRNA (guanine527-N7)-methyltransferase